MKKSFLVGIREVHVSHRRIKADTGEEALNRYLDGEDEGEEVFCEYSHTLDPDTFTVEPEDTVCAHELDWASATPADGALGVMDVSCLLCGASGSFKIYPADVNW